MTRAIVTKFGITLFAIGMLFSTGCSSMSNTGRDALAGGAIGTGAGALVGMATGNPKTGAVIGGLLGTGVGAAIGSEADHKEKEQLIQRDIAQAQAAEANAPISRGPLSVEDVIAMSKVNPATNSRVSDDILIQYIRTTNSQYNLSPGDLQYLTANGVSDRVIQEMMASRNRPVTRVVPSPRTVYVQQPQPVVVYEPPYYPPYYYRPPPPSGVWIGGRIR